MKMEEVGVDLYVYITTGAMINCNVNVTLTKRQKLRLNGPLPSVAWRVASDVLTYYR